jgi:hypothetical protein
VITQKGRTLSNAETFDTQPPHAIDELGRRVRDPVGRPGDGGYDEERGGFQTAYRHRPGVGAVGHAQHA